MGRLRGLTRRERECCATQALLAFPFEGAEGGSGRRHEVAEYRRPEVYRRLAAEWAAWNTNMLPEAPKAYTFDFPPEHLVDHFAPGAKP